MYTTFLLAVFTAYVTAVASNSISPNPSSSAGLPAASPTKYKHFDCGTNISHASEHFKATIHRLHQESLHEGEADHSGSVAGKAAKLATRAASTTGTILVNTYFHVVTKQSEVGTVTQAMVNEQIAELNNQYKPHGIQFNLLNTSFTANDAWAVDASDTDDMNMKGALRQGTYSALNLYFQTDLAGGILGRCTLPTNVGSNPSPSQYVVDGCNIAAQTMPGGAIYGYNMGRTAVHETGHWLGLLHTFEGYSCSGNGDYIADTPQESQSTDGCPTNPWKNTCASTRKGVDPIHNFMDYSTDACYTRFTPNQEARIRSLWPMYRQGH